MTHWLQPFRVAARSLRKAPGASTTAVLTLALGIGATTAIFSVVDAVLLKTLPFAEPGRLVRPAAERTATGERWTVTYADFLEWRERRVFAEVAVYQQDGVDLAGEDGPLRVQAAAVSLGFFPALGVAPALGRGFRPEELDPNSGRVVLLGEELWRRRFGGDLGLVGSAVRLNGNPATVVGIVPRGLGWPREAEIWVPLRLGTPDADLLRRDNYIFESIARLAPGVSLEATRARLAALAARVEREEPAARAGITMTAVPLAEWEVGPALARGLWLLLGAVLFVLLIGCVNIANLLLVRAAGRRRELAVRSALGAGRLRLLGQLLAESLLLAGTGGVLGALLAAWGIRALVALAPGDVPGLAGAHLNGSVLAFTAVVSLLAALAFGLAPALHGSTAQPAAALAGEGPRSTTGAGGRRLRNAFVVAEVALAIVLLVGAGLTVRSLLGLSRVDPGFDPRPLLTLSLQLPAARYETDESRAAFFETLTERVRSIPGVEGAAVSSALPLGGGGFYLGRSFLAEGRPEPPAGVDVGAMWNVVGPGYFRTAGMPLLQGRDFGRDDDADGPPVAIVNEQFVRAMFPDGKALGRRVRSWRDENVLREIVGVVRDVRYFGAADEPQPLIYVPHRQNTWSAMSLTVRTAGKPEAVVAAVRREVSALDRDLAVADVATMDRVFARSVAAPRFGTLLLAGFAALALALAALGIYGVLSYTVSQRTREIGVRMALGARAGDVVGMVVREALLLVLAGIALGVAGAVAATRALRSLLYGVSATDPGTFAGVALLLAVVALTAAWLPARRASRVGPTTALRGD